MRREKSKQKQTSVCLWPFQQESNPTYPHWKHLFPFAFASFFTCLYPRYFPLSSKMDTLCSKPVSFSRLQFPLLMQDWALSCGYSACQPSILSPSLHSQLLTGITQGHCILCALPCARILMVYALSHLGLLHCTLPASICLWSTCVSCHFFSLYRRFLFTWQPTAGQLWMEKASKSVIHETIPNSRNSSSSMLSLCLTVFFYSACASFELSISFPAPLQWGGYNCESTHPNLNPNLGERVHFHVYYIAISLDKV